MNYKLIEVTWIDACLEEAHLSLAGAKSVRPCQRVNTGYLLEEADDHIVITFGCIGAEEYDMAFAIPKVMIIERRELS